MSKAQRTAKFKAEQLRSRLPGECKKLVALYDSRRAPEGIEPTWMHPAYEALSEFVKGDESEVDFVTEMVESLNLPDFYVMKSMFGTRVIHDGWKIATPSWVFMGRNDPVMTHRYLNTDWVIVGRRIPERAMSLLNLPPHLEHVYIAYHLHDEMGMTAMTANCIGPFMTHREVVDAINAGTNVLRTTTLYPGDSTPRITEDVIPLD